MKQYQQHIKSIDTKGRIQASWPVACFNKQDDTWGFYKVDDDWG